MARDPIVGQPLICAFEYRLDGVLIDPAIVRLLVRSPSGALTEYVYPSAELTRVAQGMYEATFTPDVGGTWACRATGLGGVAAVQEDVVNVASSFVI